MAIRYRKFFCIHNCNNGIRTIPCSDCPGDGRPCKTCRTKGTIEVECECVSTYASQGSSLDQTSLNRQARLFSVDPSVKGSKI